MTASNPAFTPPYPPSWIDRFTRRVARLPGPDWLFYLGLWLVLFVLLTAIQWSAASLRFGAFRSFHLVVTAAGPLLLLLSRHLNLTATGALARARPLLTLNEAEYQALAYRFTTLPFGAAIVAGLLSLLSPLLDLLDPSAFFQESQVAQTPLSMAMTLALTVFIAFSEGAVLYQLYRQTRLVSFIHHSCVRVDLFQLSPLYGFSRLTSQASLVLMLLAGAFYLAQPSLIENQSNVLLLFMGTFISIAIFILPLVGAHNRIAAEKERMLAETKQRIKAVIEKHHQAIDREEWSAAEQAKSTLAGLDNEQQLLGRIPTWPWQPETPRLIITALLMPIILFTLQYFIQRLLAL